MEHTKGPWRQTTSTVYDQIETADGELICFLGMKENSKANARLIAAAPDLLAACELAAKYVSKMVADDVKTAMPPIIALNRIEAVINRAKGE